MTQNYHFWLIILLFSLPLSTSAQVDLEYTYPTTDLHRVNWTYGGEKYWYSNDSLKEIKIFSAQHQPVKTIRYPSVPNVQVRLLRGEHGLTQTTINPDNLLEMVWLIKDTVLKQEKLQIRNELDSVLFRYETPFESVNFSEIEGLATKMFVSSFENGISNYISKVYSLPSFQLENVYFAAKYLHRKKFGYAGEKYFYKGVESKMMHIYNPNHSFWKNVNLAWFPSISLDNNDFFTDADDNIFSKDSLVEVSYSYWTSTSSNNIILSENGRIYNPDKTDFRIDKKLELEDKIIAVDWSSTVSNKYRFVKLNDFVPKIEFERFNPISRFFSNKYGEVFVSYLYPGVNLSYSGQSPRRVTLPANSTYIPFNFYYFQGNNPFVYINDSSINKDTLFEMIYVEKHNDMHYFRINIVNDTGKIYQNIDSTKFFNINNIKGLQPKLITKTGNDNPYNTKVWRLGGATTPIKETPSVLKVKIYPNPSHDEIKVELLGSTEVRKYDFTVYNLLGQAVFSTSTNSNQCVLKKEYIGKGYFIVKISSGQKVVTKQIIFE